ncbi:MAG TPA: O-methyltransferase [Armatimonadota bacterium]|nr:O-methyltransferase [Armatimonadota bacterium]
MPITWDETQSYLLNLSQLHDAVLARMEEEARRDHFPIIDRVGGNLCYLLSRAIGARRVFELGSGYGYSTLWFAKAVRENGGGEVHHTVWHKDLHDRARANISEAGYDDIVRFHLGEAVETLRGVDGPFDVLFNDIDKDGYPASLPVMKEKLRVGGLIIIDNMLHHGSVFNSTDTSASANGVREFTRLLQADNDFVSQLIPIRDGITVALRIG